MNFRGNRWQIFLLSAVSENLELTLKVQTQITISAFLTQNFLFFFILPSGPKWSQHPALLMIYQKIKFNITSSQVPFSSGKDSISTLLLSCASPLQSRASTSRQQSQILTVKFSSYSFSTLLSMYFLWYQSRASYIGNN